MLWYPPSAVWMANWPGVLEHSRIEASMSSPSM